MSAAIVAVVSTVVAFLLVLTDAALLAAEHESEAPSTIAHADEHRALAFARVLAQLFAGASTAVALDLPRRPGLGATLIALAVAVVVVAVSEAAAREIGDALGARLVPALMPLARAAGVVLAPVIYVNARLDAVLLRALPPAAVDEASREETVEQFREVIASEADVAGGQQSLLAGVFSLGDRVVHEIMVPRVDIVGVERDMPWSEVVDRVRSAAHSRVPVYEESIDEIVGILYAKDLLPNVIAGEPPSDGWGTLVRPGIFIPPTKRVDEQLRDFRASGTHIAIVVDEYGGTAGLVTIEDVLEEIVGEIQDEYDDEDERPIDTEGDDRFWVAGRVTLDELSEVTGADFHHDDVSTVGGLVYEIVGRVPRNGERLTIGDFRVVVERVVRRQIRRVYFERIAPAVVDRATPETATASVPAPDGSRPAA